jgi:hypothetical protein
MESVLVPLGKSQVRYLKPTEQQLEQIIGGKGLSLTPQINHTKTPLLDRFESGIDKFNRILGLVEKFGQRPEPKHQNKKPEPKESDLPASLKDPWGDPKW